MAAAVPIQLKAGLEPILLPEDIAKKRAALARAAPPTPQPDRINDAGEMVVAICEETSKRANAYCSDVVDKTFPSGTKINACKLHKPPTSTEEGDEALPTPSEREPTPSPAPRRRRRRQPEPEEEQRRQESPRRNEDERRSEEDSGGETEVTICAETSKRATSYCPEKVTKRFSAGTRVRSCSLHRARPGEEDR